LVKGETKIFLFSSWAAPILAIKSAQELLHIDWCIGWMQVIHLLFSSLVFSGRHKNKIRLLMLETLKKRNKQLALDINLRQTSFSCEILYIKLGYKERQNSGTWLGYL
jgi:hypothetical protein